ncbi:hypothetical protein BKG96_03260 [Rodentibacter caecimuris]|uniref:Uncharacterized protein n=1 Tax=Rodentibacter caecimuris TaxID=1796644 RepID=A0A1V3KN65_9PAST|nr:hypothetical protein [Rodentibacter heylii]OOF79094.1 hypothetical protein BKG96_03260 [Rodentibacter heylii]
MMNEYQSLEELHASGKYISNQYAIFSEAAKQEHYRDLADFLTPQFDDVVNWLNSITPEKWDKLFKDLKLIEQEHIKNLENIRILSCSDIMVDGSNVLDAITRLQQALNHIGFMLMAGGAISKNIQRIVARNNRNKRKDKPNPNIGKARDLAKKIWIERSKTTLLDVAYEVKEKLHIRKGVGTIQEWIRDLNPNSKKKSK